MLVVETVSTPASPVPESPKVLGTALQRTVFVSADKETLASCAPDLEGVNVNVPLPPVVATAIELGPVNPLFAVALTFSVALEFPTFVKLTACVDEPGHAVSEKATEPVPVRARIAPRELRERETSCATSPEMSVLIVIFPEYDVTAASVVGTAGGVTTTETDLPTPTAVPPGVA